ncbi:MULTISPECIES: AMP-binding protein [unclassified Streptomyces]|uniref:AMP-binding protein n=1 Tax=unclassified Streptomyces TaxID=2593676 RepID=UPI000CD589C3|nr:MULTISPECIES: AMP-binding protein [unclassified Streptomyces]
MNFQQPEDRHLAADGLTHAALVERARRAAEGLARLGVRSGSRLAVALPTCPESFVVTLACLRLDAVRISLPLGDHTGWVRHRIRSAGAHVVVTADSCLRDGQVVPVKAGLDQALSGCPDVRNVVVVSQQPRPVPWTPGRDLWWEELTGDDVAAAGGLRAGLTLEA